MSEISKGRGTSAPRYGPGLVRKLPILGRKYLNTNFSTARIFGFVIAWECPQHRAVCALPWWIISAPQHPIILRLSSMYGRQIHPNKKAKKSAISLKLPPLPTLHPEHIQHVHNNFTVPRKVFILALMQPQHQHSHTGNLHLSPIITTTNRPTTTRKLHFS